MFKPYLHIHFVHHKSVSMDLLQKVKSIFQRFPAYIRFELHPDPLEVDNNSWPSIFSAIRDFRQTEKIPVNQVICLFSAEQNDRNWFSVTDTPATFEMEWQESESANQPNILLQTNDWDIFTPRNVSTRLRQT